MNLDRLLPTLRLAPVLIDSAPYRQWYESHYTLHLRRKKGAKLTPEEKEILNKKRSKKIQKKYHERQKNAKISSLLEEQFQQGKLLACIAKTRPVWQSRWLCARRQGA
ncbi:40S ribosomal protein S8 [Sigmodon hispidus]